MNWREDLAEVYIEHEKKFDPYRQSVGEYIDRRLAELTDEEILADNGLLAWLYKASLDHAGASRRLKKLTGGKR